MNGIAHISFLIIYFLFYSGTLIFGQGNSLHSQETQDKADANWFIERLSIKEGLSQSSIGAIVSDHQGFLWIGTEDGLNRYDGYEFKTFKHQLEDPRSLSNSWINCIIVDSLDNLWIGTSDGLNYFDKKTELFHRFYHERNDVRSLSNSHITQLSFDRHGQLWIGTQNGLNIKTNSEPSFSRLENDPLVQESSDQYTVYSLLVDSKDRIWVGRENRLSLLNNKGEVIKEFDSENSSESSSKILDGVVRKIIEKKSGGIWIGCESLLKYDETTRRLKKVEIKALGTRKNALSRITELYEDAAENLWVGTKNLYRLHLNEEDWNVQYFKEDLQNLNSVSLGSFVSSITEDINGNIWIGAWAGGLSKLENKQQRFQNLRYYTDQAVQNQIPTVTGLLVDAREDVWIGTWGGGLSIWNQKKNEHFAVASSQDYRSAISNDVITGIFEDSKGMVWICTQNSGLFVANPSLEQVINYTHDPNDPYSISSNYLSYVFEDVRGQIWVSSKFEGLNLFNSAAQTFTTFRHDPEVLHSISDNQVRAIVEDPTRAQLWIGTINGGLNMFDLKTKKFTSFKNDKSDPHSLPSNLISELFVDSKNRLWVGTTSGLSLMSFDQPGHFMRYSIKDGLPNDVIYAIEEDQEGRLWISTNAGMTCFDPETEKFNNYNIEDGLLDTEYNGLVSSKNLRTGEMFFGSVRSVTHFQPEHFQIDSNHSPLIITNSTRYNSSENKGAAIKDLFIKDDEELTYDYQDKIINFQLSSLNYNRANNVKYQYHLEGFSEEWYDLNENREIVLTNLDPGDYTLFAKAKNQDEIWSPSRKMTSFVVFPPWYSSNWAYLFYGLGLFVIVWTFYNFQKRRWKLRTQLQLEQAEAVRLKELDRHKNNLFANITHEFRTPLTMILGLTDQVKKNPKVGLQSKLGIVERNGKQLLSLVNQVLDLTKLQTGKVEVNYMNGDIMAYIGYLVESYQSFAISSQKTLSCFCYPKTFTMDYEPEIIQRIIENLISNSLKFTNEYGQIKVEVTTSDHQLQIEVTDNGIGIAEKDLPFIFDRFYQVDDSSVRQNEGTGIGLALVKELVELLGGDISVSSEEGIHTIIVAKLPVTNKAPSRIVSKEEIQSHIKSANILIPEDTRPEDFDNEALTFLSKDDRPILLIIEDNNDVITYIMSCLKDNYEYIIGRNGKKGKDLALEYIPDIIITDLMMPVMDGFEVCEQLKLDPKTSHIPIIMLTARASLQDRLTGLSKGADAYLSKPFNEEELHIRIENLLENRRAMQRQLQGSSDSNNLESTFLKEVKLVIFEHIDDENFDVNRLCREMGMSRAQLHRKIKALTDFSTGQFIRSIRMKEARKLLETGKYNVSEVADKVGFRHHTSFTVAFKNEYGVPPSKL